MHLFTSFDKIQVFGYFNGSVNQINCCLINEINGTKFLFEAKIKNYTLIECKVNLTEGSLYNKYLIFKYYTNH